jgi:hypothetical protein
MLYFGGAVASALVLTVVLRSSYMVPTMNSVKLMFENLPVFAFFVSWTIVCASLALDIKSCMDMYSHLTHPIDNCVPVNQPNMFTPFMPNDDYFSFTAALSNCKRPDGNSRRLPSTYSFTEIVIYCVQRPFESRPGYSASVIASFAKLCSSIRGCSYTDAPEFKCAFTHPDAAEFGGTLYSRFAILVLFALSLRLAVDAARGVAVAISCWHHSLAWHPMAADFIGTSPFSVFLLASLPRDDFVRDVSKRDPSHRDYLLRSIHSVLLSALPILLVNVYFASRVAQTGLSSVSLISTLYGAVTIPLLFVRAFMAWRRADPAFTDAELNVYVEMQQGVGVGGVKA